MSYIEIDLDDYASEISTSWLRDELSKREVVQDKQFNKDEIVNLIINKLELDIVRAEKLKTFIKELKQ